MIFPDRHQSDDGRDGPPPPTAGTVHGQARITSLRQRIDEIDTVLIDLLQQRARLSAEVQRTRVAHDGPPLDPGREKSVRGRFHHQLGQRGGEMADAVLYLCRGMPSAAPAGAAGCATSGGRK